MALSKVHPLFCFCPSRGVLFIFLGDFTFQFIYFLSTLSTTNSLRLQYPCFNLSYTLTTSFFPFFSTQLMIINLLSASNQHSLIIIHFQASSKNSDLAFSLFTHSIFFCHHFHSISLTILVLPFKPPYLKPFFFFWLYQPLFPTYLTPQHIST